MISKKLLLTQWPVFHSPDTYEESIQSMCSTLKSIPGIKSIYQVGGVSDYGISDIDMLVIFDNNVSFKGNPLLNEGLPANRYLFTHRLFGTTENRILDLENFTRFGKYKILYGHPYSFSVTLPEKELKILEKQIALEYMVKAFISLHIAFTYGMVKVRNLLLHIKALKLDLELLNVQKGPLSEIVDEFILMRKKWFEKTPDTRQLEIKIIKLYQVFIATLEELLQQIPFYLPDNNELKISRNISLKKASAFHPPDISIPPFLCKIIPINRRESVLNRLFQFCFHFPLNDHNVPEIIQLRYDYIRRGVEFNKTHLPYFLCTAYGLDIFSRKF